jgi:hypothetical protein
MVVKVAYTSLAMKKTRHNLSDLAIRDRIQQAAATDRSPQEIAHRYGVSHAYIWQLRALLRLKGEDGEAIKDAIDQKTLAWSRIARAVQATDNDEDLIAVQKTLLAARSIGRKIARGYDPTRSAGDGRRTRSGRRKKGS